MESLQQYPWRISNSNAFTSREVYKGAIKKGYCHYINAETVYSCYTQYRNGSCVASAANSSLHYFDQDSNYLLYNTMIKKTVFHYVFV